MCVGVCAWVGVCLFVCLLCFLDWFIVLAGSMTLRWRGFVDEKVKRLLLLYAGFDGDLMNVLMSSNTGCLFRGLVVQKTEV